MKLLIMKSLWGMTGPLEEQVERIAAAGYDGIEHYQPEPKLRPVFKRLLRKHRLGFIGMIFTGGPDHAKSFETQAQGMLGYDPISFTAHTGTDSMRPAEAVALFRNAVRIERELDVPVAHETHRGRVLFTPWTTAAMLRAVPELTLCADFSHWCCVCESYLEWNVDPADLELAISRTIHIHTRVGYPEGPQVPDPRAAEWQDALRKHEAWWSRMLKARQQSGAKFATITPEFGPPDYLHTLPHTRQPVADLWEICLWMKERIRNGIGKKMEQSRRKSGRR